MSEYSLLFLCAVLVSSISQIILKKSANAGHRKIIREYFNKYIISGYILFFTATLINVMAYKGLPFKYGSILESAGYFMILILSNIFLREKITMMKLLGNIVIVIGIIIFNL